jgi:hypothetical protein
MSTSVIHHELSREETCKVNAHKWNAMFLFYRYVIRTERVSGLGLPIGVSWLITLSGVGGGGAKAIMGTLFTKESSQKDGEDSFDRRFFHFFSVFTPPK